MLVRRGRCVLRTVQYHGCVSAPNQVGESLTKTSHRPEPHAVLMCWANPASHSAPWPVPTGQDLPFTYTLKCLASLPASSWSLHSLEELGHTRDISMKRAVGSLPSVHIFRLPVNAWLLSLFRQIGGGLT